MTEQNGNGKELAQWGDREMIRDLSGRIKLMLPGVMQLPQHLQGPAALGIAQISVQMGLNPFVGELWPIPQKRGGDVVGFNIMVGIKGLRRKAKEQAREWGFLPPYYRQSWRWPDENEIKAIGLRDGDVAIICQLELFLPKDHPYFTDGYKRFQVEGVGIYRKGEKTKMERFQVLRKRAESDALKQAFDLPLTTEGEGRPVIEGDFTVSDADTSAEIVPESAIPEFVDRADPHRWNPLITQLMVDYQCLEPGASMIIKGMLKDLGITYVDNANIVDVIDRIAQRLETSHEDMQEKVEQFIAAGGDTPQTPKRAFDGYGVAPSGWGDLDRPAAALAIKTMITTKIDKSARALQLSEISKGRMGLLRAKLPELFPGDKDARGKGRSVLTYLTGSDSVGSLSNAQASVLLGWMLKGKADDSGDYPLHVAAATEAANCYRARLEELGQMPLFNDDAEGDEPDATDEFVPQGYEPDTTEESEESNA